MSEILLVVIGIVLASALVLVQFLGLSLLTTSGLIAAALAATASVWVGLGAVHRHQQQSDIPAAFRGAPIILISAGILCLAVLGFSGVVQP